MKRPKLNLAATAVFLVCSLTSQFAAADNTMGKDIAAGAVAGGLAGTIVGLATCVPVAWLPPAYGLCVAHGMVLGVLGGGVAGGVAGGAAKSGSRPQVKSESAFILEPGEQATDDERVASRGPTFEETRESTDQTPENNAIAVAIDARQWAWGTASAEATEDRAKDLALHRCREQASLKGIAKGCGIYSVNGQAIYLDPK